MYKNKMETKIKTYVKQLQHMHMHLYIYEKEVVLLLIPLNNVE